MSRSAMPSFCCISFKRDALCVRTNDQHYAKLDDHHYRKENKKDSPEDDAISGKSPEMIAFINQCEKLPRQSGG